MKRRIAIIGVAVALALAGCGGGSGGETPAAEDTVTTTTINAVYTGPGSGMLSQVDKAKDVADSLEQRNAGLESQQP